MTILFDGRTSISNGSFSGYRRYAGYGNNLGPGVNINQGPAPDGIDRIAIVRDPLGSLEQVLRTYLKPTDPVGVFTAGSNRTEVTRINGAPESNFETTYLYSWWVLVPNNWEDISEPRTMPFFSGSYTSLLQLHDTSDGDNGTSAPPSSIDTTANSVTFAASVIWPDLDIVRWQSLGGTIPAPFVENTSYYVINPTASNTIKLASSFANAQAGTAIDISSVGSGSFRLYDQARAPTLMFAARGGLIEALGAHQNITGVTGFSKRILASVPLRKDVWMNFTVRAKWSYGSTGTLEIWHGDTRGIHQIFKDIATLNTWNDDTTRGGGMVYPTFGCYHPSAWLDGNTFRMAYHKGVMVGDSSETPASISGVRELDPFPTYSASMMG